MNYPYIFEHYSSCHPAIIIIADLFDCGITIIPHRLNILLRFVHRNRECLFGEVVNEKIVLNDFGKLPKKNGTKPRKFGITANIDESGQSNTSTTKAKGLAKLLLRTHHPKRKIIEPNQELYF